MWCDFYAKLCGGALQKKLRPNLHNTGFSHFAVCNKREIRDTTLLDLRNLCFPITFDLFSPIPVKSGNSGIFLMNLWHGSQACHDRKYLSMNWSMNSQWSRSITFFLACDKKQCTKLVFKINYHKIRTLSSFFKLGSHNNPLITFRSTTGTGGGDPCPLTTDRRPPKQKVTVCRKRGFERD